MFWVKIYKCNFWRKVQSCSCFQLHWLFGIGENTMIIEKTKNSSDHPRNHCAFNNYKIQLNKSEAQGMDYWKFEKRDYEKRSIVSKFNNFNKNTIEKSFQKELWLGHWYEMPRGSWSLKYKDRTNQLEHFSKLENSSSFKWKPTRNSRCQKLNEDFATFVSALPAKVPLNDKIRVLSNKKIVITMNRWENQWKMEKEKKTIHHDGISNKMLKCWLLVIEQHLTRVFNNLLDAQESRNSLKLQKFCEYAKRQTRLFSNISTLFFAVFNQLIVEKVYLQ